jgi:hypothetical protein
MKPQEYLEQVLKRESLSDNSDEMKALRSEREKVEILLRDTFKESNPTIRYAGSKAKGTMIRESYDLDITCYFEHEDEKAGKTLKDIFDNVKKGLESKYVVSAKSSALRLLNKDPNNYSVDFHIDVVPGRYINEDKNDIFLYQSGGDKERLQTSLDKHVEHIKGSELQEVIKLMKVWKIRKGFQIKTFVLELLVVEVLKKKDPEKLDKCLITLWEKLRDDIENIKIEDPANPTGNDLSKLFNESIKSALKSAATSSLFSVENDQWKDIFGTVESVSSEQKIAAFQSIKVASTNTSKPWVP